MTAVRDFVRTYERHCERRAPSAPNDSNNGCNEFKQFRIAEWRRAASVSTIFTGTKPSCVHAVGVTGYTYY